MLGGWEKRTREKDDPSAGRSKDRNKLLHRTPSKELNSFGGRFRRPEVLGSVGGRRRGPARGLADKDERKEGKKEQTYRLGSKHPAFLRTSATIGTVELTGFEMTQMKAFGQFCEIAVARSETMPALIWGRSVAGVSEEIEMLCMQGLDTP